MSTSQTLCVQNIAHKNEALHGYVSPLVGPRELYRLEIALKIIIPVPTIYKHGTFSLLNIYKSPKIKTLKIN